MIWILSTIIFSLCIHNSVQSIGDSSPFYQKCVERCAIFNCTDDGINFKDDNKQPLILKLTLWTCEEECRYDCMWETVFSFHKRKWRVPQFHGKWPFIRMFGLQEPASVLFSLLNLYVHLKMIMKFRKEVSSDSPLYYLWHMFCMVCVNCWLWSTIFHARDSAFTELMDYSCAFSMVLMSCYCMCYRIFRYLPRSLLVIISTFFGAFFMNHIAYLSMGYFSYMYNMQLNIGVGTVTVLSWLAWCAYNRKRQPYVWKCAAFVILSGLSTVLEVFDYPPIFFMYDLHSLWHLSTAPIVVLFYNFVIDDCKYLKKIGSTKEKGKIL